MTRQQKKNTVGHNHSHSKSSKEGLGILTDEIELALRWKRPCILIAVHKSKAGQIKTQEKLGQEISKKGGKVLHITAENTDTDLIRLMSERNQSDNIVFFVSELDSANRTFGGGVYMALNLKREILVDEKICAVFWLNESEAATLPRLAPDFWAFRHRSVEFAPTRGTRTQSIPAGLFLWKEQIPFMDESSIKDKLTYYENFLDGLPAENESMSAQFEIMLKLTQLCWLANDTKKFGEYLNNGFSLLNKYPTAQHSAWMLNTKGIGLFEEGKKVEAEVCFTQALAHDPENSTLLMNKAIAIYGLGKNRDSIVKGRQVAQRDQGNPHILRALGYLSLSMEKMEDAIEAMTKAGNLSPQNMDINLALAVCYYKNNQLSECEKAITNVEKISGPQNALHQICFGIMKGQGENTLHLLKQAIKTSEIKKHDIQRDPNLFFLLSPADRLEFN
jgi:tetratricopeptide (TPR) repeat protein